MSRPSTSIVAATLATGLAFTPFALPALLTGSPTPAPVVSEQIDAPAAAQTTEQIINGLISAIGRSKAPLPIFALDIANRAYNTWKLHRLSQKTAEIEKEVVAVLRTVHDMAQQMDAGRAMSEREARFARAALQAHDRRLDHLTSRVGAIEQGTRESEARIAKLEAANKVLMAENKALRASNQNLTRRLLRDSCGAGRKRGAQGCVDDPQ